MSAPRDDSVYLGHIRDAAARVESYLDNVTEAQFFKDTLVQDAVIRQIQVIGEATKRVSSELRATTPEIPWKDVAGMRDKLVHDYMGVDLEAVWDAAVNDVPDLLEKLKHMPGPDGFSSEG